MIGTTSAGAAPSMPWRLWTLLRSHADWLAILSISLLIFTGLATAGRLPAVDLPQHALFLQRILDGPQDIYEVRWVVPYAALFALTLPLAQLVGPVEAIWVGMAIALALVPLAGAVLARTLGRPAVFAVFTLSTLFSAAAAWGFASLVLSATCLALSAAVSIRYARAPTPVRGLAVVAMITITYFAHFAGWLLTMLLCVVIVPVWLRRWRIRDLWPLAMGMLVTLGLCNAWLLPKRKAWAEGVGASLFDHAEPSAAERLARLPLSVAEVGRAGELTPPAMLLAILFLWYLLAGASRLRTAVRRARRLRSKHAAPAVTLRSALRRFGPSIAWCTCVGGYFVVPLWVSGVLMVYPRLLLFAAVLAPVAAPARTSRTMRALGWLALLPALWLVSEVIEEARFNAERTACVDELSSHLREHEALLGLFWMSTSPGYGAPVDVHLAAEIAARHGGMNGKDFTDFVAGPVVYREGYDRIVVPPNLVWDGRYYDHATHGGEFTAWMLAAPPPLTSTLLARMAPDRSRHRVYECGVYTLVIDTAAKPHPHRGEVFLPHRHAEGEVCTLELHGRGGAGAPR